LNIRLTIAKNRRTGYAQNMQRNESKHLVLTVDFVYMMEYLASYFGKNDM